MKTPENLDVSFIEHREWHLWILAIILIMALGTITVATYLLILDETGRQSGGISTAAYRTLGGLFILITIFCFYAIHTRTTFSRLRSLLVEMSGMTATTMESNLLLNAFTSRIARAGSVTTCQIALLSESGLTLKLRSAHSVRKMGWTPQIGKAYPLYRLSPLAPVFEGGGPLLVRHSHLKGIPDAVDALELISGRQNAIRASLIVPMITKNRLLGIVILGEARNYSRAGFNSSRRLLIQALANQVATAIDHARLLREVIEKSDAVKEAHFDSIKALAEALETKDVYTRGHSDRTVRHCVRIARAIGLSEREQEWIRYAAILHDIGKIGIPESILNKAAPLNDAEFQIMKKHPLMGAEIVRHIKYLDPCVPMILHDHEWFNGSGYPNGLSGEAIPLGSRIIALVDAYDAMTTDRVYRKALPGDKAIAELRGGAGTQFDPSLTEVFIKLLEQ